MSTPLQKALRPASYRGVPFEVEVTEMGVGRRTQVHEYPQRDKPWTEDMGRATRELTFDAFVTGADYVAKANALIAALEEEGEAELVHPWFGTLTVDQKELARVSFSSQLGVARFSLSFVESGDLEFPSAVDSTEAQTRLAADGLEGASVADFAGKFSISGWPDFVGLGAINDLKNIFSTVSIGGVSGLDMLGYADRAAGMMGSAVSVLSTPESLGWTVARFLGVTPLLNTAFRYQVLSKALVRLSQHNAFTPPYIPPSMATPSPTATAITPSRAKAITNTQAINALTRQVLLAQAVGVSSLVKPEVYDDAVDLRVTLVAALDAETLNASDATYAALTTARAAVWRDLTTRSRDSARLMTRTPTETMPAVALAYDLYEDATRADEIATRNRIRHLGFVPPMPLKVLTR